MRSLFKANAKLQTLSQYIKDQTEKVTIQLSKGKSRPITTRKANGSNEERQTEAATVIERFWRRNKLRKAIVDNPYFAYLSLIDPNDKQRTLSGIMFGRHEAELRVKSKDRMQNPLIFPRAAYHRIDERIGKIFNFQDEILTKKLNITYDDKKKYYYVPVSALKSIPVEEILKPDLYPGIKIIKKEGIRLL
jgi:hypothetical protein